MKTPVKSANGIIIIKHIKIYKLYSINTFNCKLLFIIHLQNGLQLTSNVYTYV